MVTITRNDALDVFQQTEPDEAQIRRSFRPLASAMPSRSGMSTNAAHRRALGKKRKRSFSGMHSRRQRRF